jgi:CelD/BcsL family acetyltransferase involved in cellulose biosynthesis
MPRKGRISLQIVSDITKIGWLREDWSALLARSDNNEIALSPDWLVTWWSVYGSSGGRQLKIALFFDDARLVGLAPLLLRQHWYGVIPYRRLEFLASGEREDEGIYSNHLSVVAERGAEEVVTSRMVTALLDGELGAWDEIVFQMMTGDGHMFDCLSAAFQLAGLRPTVLAMARAPYVKLPDSWASYLRSLSRNQRRQITRSLRNFASWSNGESHLHSATDPSLLAEGRRILIELHQMRWASSPHRGVFRKANFLKFNEIITTKLQKAGLLELLWLSVRGQPVSAVLAMIWNNKVYAYQTGRRVDVPSSVRPGFVILVMAIQRAIESGRREFDLLADEAPYKLQLANHSRPLVQMRVSRAPLREQMLAWAKHFRNLIRLGESHAETKKSECNGSEESSNLSQD